MTMSEFAHVVTLAEVGQARTLKLDADAPARLAIASRLDLVALDHFVVDAVIRAVAGGIGVRGTVAAKIVQRCAATDLPVPATIHEDFDLKFLRDAQDGDEVDLELDAEAIDVLPLEHDRVDLGDVAIQTLSLALDPFPRHRDADRILAEKGVLSEAAAGPFAALAALQGKSKA